MSLFQVLHDLAGVQDEIARQGNGRARHERQHRHCGADVRGAGGTAWMHWSANDRAGSDFTARYVETIWELLPDDAVLIVSGDAAISRHCCRAGLATVGNGFSV